MRLWHPQLIPELDSRRLCDLHQTCCAMRGNGWGKKNKLIDWVWQYGEDLFYNYHAIVLRAMCERGFNPDYEWIQPEYCGKYRDRRVATLVHSGERIYKEFTDSWLLKDVLDLQRRGQHITLIYTTNGFRVERYWCPL